MYRHDMEVKTPLGIGRYQAPFAVVDGKGEPVVIGYLVRIPVAVAGAALNKSNCLTPTAKLTGLWVFKSSEVTPC